MAHQDIVMVIHYKNCKNKWCRTFKMVQTHSTDWPVWQKTQHKQATCVIQYKMCGNVCGDSPLEIVSFHHCMAWDKIEQTRSWGNCSRFLCEKHIWRGKNAAVHS